MGRGKNLYIFSFNLFMRYFFQRILQFLIPPLIFILIIIIVQKNTYQISGGDLNRIGKISFSEEYKNFHKSNDKIYYSDLADINLKDRPDIDILIFGDSFCRLGKNGLPNFLAKESKKTVVNTNFYMIQHPLDGVYQLLNGGFFDSTNVRFVLLQSVVRSWSKMLSLDENSTLKFDDLLRKKPYFPMSSYESYEKINLKNKELNIFNKYKVEFDNSIKYILFNLLYYFDDNAFGLSPIHVFKLKQNLFSERNNTLLVYGEDITNMKNFNLNISEQLNEKLNKLAKNLSKKNIKLIYVPTANKYDIYYPYIYQNNKYRKSNFFKLLKEQKKEYIYIDTDELLTNAVRSGEIDLYLADDSHWSYKAAIIVSKNILSKINLINEK